jgi:septal ring factor EnvC (AmiA/AmiB activator)
MKNFLQNLLIFFALCLCGMMVFQWVRETRLNAQVQQLTDTVHEKSEAIQTLQTQVRRDEEEIKRLDTLKNELNSTIKSNRLDIARLTKDLDKAKFENDKNLQQIEVYKEAIQTANDNIKKQNEDIKRQNGEMKKLAEDRNEIVKKFNKTAADYNALVTKWNAQQEELAKAATNKPAKK